MDKEQKVQFLLRNKVIPASLSSIRAVIDLADDGRRDSFQNFQSMASMCFTSDFFPWFTGVITYPPPVCLYEDLFRELFQMKHKSKSSRTP